jgi:dolichyl-phosphate beta-glucosyltransferase
VDLSLVIPCRNEAERLPDTLRATSACMDGLGLQSEVIVVVEPGDDPTPEVLEEFAAKDARIRPILNPQARGKGFAVRTGMLAATGSHVFFMDADLSVPLRFVREFLVAFQSGADVLVASRRHPDSLITRRQPIVRIASGRAFNAVLRLCGATPFADTQCGFKAFTAEAARAIFPHTTCDGFGFDVEVLALAESLGFRVEALPIEWRDAPGSKVRPIHGLAALAEALRGAARARKVGKGQGPATQ